MPATSVTILQLLPDRHEVVFLAVVSIQDDRATEPSEACVHVHGVTEGVLDDISYLDRSSTSPAVDTICDMKRQYAVT